MIAEQLSDEYPLWRYRLMELVNAEAGREAKLSRASPYLSPNAV